MSKSIVRNYSTSFEDAFTACVQVVQKFGYKAIQMDKANGVITFKTGMSIWTYQGQDMSIVILDSGNGVANVSIAGKMHKSGINPQIFDWGEGEKIGKKIAAELDLLLK